MAATASAAAKGDTAPPAGATPAAAAAAAAANGQGALRFEDLTIDDSLAPLDRVTRYCRSGIALQRLVHVKMLGEVAAQVGTEATVASLLPLLPPLFTDSESIIRQNLAAQILPMSLALIYDGRPQNNAAQDVPNDGEEGEERDDNSRIDSFGYDYVTSTLLPYLTQYLRDTDLDTRRCASDALSSLAAHLYKRDVEQIIAEATTLSESVGDENNKNLSKSARKKAKKMAAAAAAGAPNALSKGEGPVTPEDLKTVAANLLAELAKVDSRRSMTPAMVSESILPPILALCGDASFRVRRAAVQALPRVMAGGDVTDAALVVVFEKLSKDDMYRVRKCVGECLVDMSRSIMLLADRKSSTSGDRERLFWLRREKLIPICTALLADPNKFVRHGMQQFLGPFVASFYPLGGGGRGVMSLLESNAAEQHGSGQLSVLGARFFPHAAGMVGRLNPGSAAAEAAEAAVLTGDASTASKFEATEHDKLLKMLPPFLVLTRSDQATLRAIVAHRNTHPPHAEDLEAVREHLLPHFVGLAEFNSGDENLDAEMRVYCAYSLPGVMLLMGSDSWKDDEKQLLRNCFLTLSTGIKIKKEGETAGDDEKPQPKPVPLPVKRCLASSFHTICYILGSEIVTTPGESATKPGILQLFEHYFLRDPDDTVRLNVMRTLPSLLSLIDQKSRSKFLPTLYSIVVGDTVLGAPARRSATNPQVINWRQRDAVSQILPDLVLLYGPREVRAYLWPVLQMLLADKVNAVRDDVEFCIPTVLRSYAPENVAAANIIMSGKKVDPNKFSAEACHEVVAYLKQSLLQNTAAGSSGSTGSYARRQMYCRTCAALAIALRLGESDSNDDDDNDIKQSPSDEDAFGENCERTRSRHPYESYSSTEYQHMLSILVDAFLPDALNMREDRVSNVRLTLVAALKVMPASVLENDEVQTILNTLQEEMATWDVGFGTVNDGFDGSVASTAGTRSTAPMPTASTTSSTAPSKSNKASRGRDRSRSKGHNAEEQHEEKQENPRRRSKFDKRLSEAADQEEQEKVETDETETKDNDPPNKAEGDDEDGDSDNSDSHHSLSSI